MRHGRDGQWMRRRGQVGTRGKGGSGEGWGRWGWGRCRGHIRKWTSGQFTFTDLDEGEGERTNGRRGRLATERQQKPYTLSSRLPSSAPPLPTTDAPDRPQISHQPRHPPDISLSVRIFRHAACHIGEAAAHNVTRKASWAVGTCRIWAERGARLWGIPG